jgi:hypothetical protein
LNLVCLFVGYCKGELTQINNAKFHTSKILEPQNFVYSSVELLILVQQFVIPVQQNLTDWGPHVPMSTPVVE